MDGVAEFGVAQALSLEAFRPEPSWLDRLDQADEVRLTFDAREKILWQYTDPCGRPCVSPGLLRGLHRTLALVGDAFREAGGGDQPVRHLVLASARRGVFNLGGDLNLFVELIRHRDAEALRRYAHACIEIVHAHATGLGRGVHTIALVQGDALGGGFEAAMGNQTLVAERGTRFGLPEVMFNLFPGMGAYTLIARRLGAVEAERMIRSGRIYTAEELHALGIVDVLADAGRGVDAVYEAVGRFERSWKTNSAVMKARQIAKPVSLPELREITDLWVETALTLDPLDMKKMLRLAAAQDRKSVAESGDRLVAG
jgi:DSF synthase